MAPNTSSEILRSNFLVSTGLDSVLGLVSTSLGSALGLSTLLTFDDEKKSLAATAF